MTSADFVREFKLLCNPASPNGAPGYFTSTIVGMKAYCDGFSKVKSTVAAIAAYVDGKGGRRRGPVSHGRLSSAAEAGPGLPEHPRDGVLLCAAGGVHEVRAGQRRVRQHTLSDGPYAITKYVPTKEFQLARNPAWDPKTDPLRNAYVDRITVTEGLTAESVQQQLEAGTGDMEWDATPPSQDLPRLLARTTSG